MQKPFLSKYLFWDIDPETVDFDKNAKFVIEKVVSKGQLEDWLEIKKFYGLERIKQECITIKSLSPRVHNFLSLILEIPKENFRCYTKRQLKQGHWIY